MNEVKVRLSRHSFFLLNCDGDAWSRHCCRKIKNFHSIVLPAFQLAMHPFPAGGLEQKTSHGPAHQRKSQSHIASLLSILTVAERIPQCQGNFAGHEEASTFLEISFAKSAGTSFASISVKSSRDGPSATFDAEGTRANQVVVQFLSSKSKFCHQVGRRQGPSPSWDAHITGCVVINIHHTRPMVELTFPNFEAHNECKQFRFENNCWAAGWISEALKVAHIKAKGNGGDLQANRRWPIPIKHPGNGGTTRGCPWLVSAQANVNR